MSRRRLKQLCFIVFAFFSINIATAVPEDETFSNLSLEELTKIKVTTISRIDESIDKAPGSIYVFSRNTIQNRGYKSLRELLQVVPGFTVFHRDLQYVAGIRGLNANDNEKVTLLINGQELNQVNEPDFLNGPINLDNVEKVEVVVGPSSLFQQANTLAATVNVITKNINGSEFIASTGNYLPYSATLMAGKEWGEKRFANFSFTTEQKKGFDAWDSDFRPNLAGRDITGKLEWPSFFSVFNAKRDEWSGQVVAYRTTQPELLISNGSKKNDAIVRDQFYSIFLKNEHPLGQDLNRIIRISTTAKDQSRINRHGLPENALQVSNKQLVYNGELGLQYKGNKHELVQLGIQGSYDHNYDSWYTLTQEDPAVTIPRTKLVNKDTYAVGFYLDDTFQAFQHLKLIGGVRIDKNKRLTGNRWFHGERAAIVADPKKNWVSKIIYNRAVRMPAPWASPLNRAWGSDKPNPPPFAQFSTNAKEPEILSTFEFQNIIYFGKYRLGTTIYHQELKDFISWLEPHTNVGNFKGNGIELNVQAPLLPHLTLWGNVSYNDSKLYASVPVSSSTIEEHHVEVNKDLRIIGAPKYTANLGSDYEFMQNLSLSPAIRYFTEQAAFDFNKQSFETIRNRYYLDATLTWKNLKVDKENELDLRLSGQNLLDNRSKVAGQWLRDTYRPQGLSIVLSMDIRL